jgi:uncharacterized protein (DUF1800 family)
MARRSTPSSFIRRNLLRVGKRAPVLPVPSALSLSLLNTDENRAAGTPIAAITGGAAGATITLISTAGNRVAKAGSNIVAGATNIDFEETPSISFVLRQVAAGFATRDQRFTLTVNDIDENIVTPTKAARFLMQSGLSSTPTEVNAVVAQGYSTWLNAQIATPRPKSFVQWQIDNAANSGLVYSNQRAFDPMVNQTMALAPDVLRHRVGHALLNFLVTAIPQLNNQWEVMAMAAYMDILWNNAFGNLRAILEAISKSPAMGFSLTFIGSKKEVAGSRPDENYAREIMQLFSIGLYQLNQDGTLVLDGQGKPIPVYDLDDVQGLARGFTGWTYAVNPSPGDYTGYITPLVNNAADHELGAKTFLGTTIQAGTAAQASLTAAIDHIFAHPNVAPFVVLRLIQSLVTSNPSPAYVGRVAAVFANNGLGVRGDLAAVVKAILLDAEARNDATALSSPTFGKQRSLALEKVRLARTFPVAATGLQGWALADDNRIIEKIGRSPSVFNWHKPEYSPPGTPLFAAGLEAPELQLLNEASVVNWVNFVQVALSVGLTNYDTGGASQTATFDTSVPLALVGNTDTLLAWLNLHIAANEVGAATIAVIKAELDSIAAPVAPLNDIARQKLYTAITMLTASPEYLGAQ